MALLVAGLKADREEVRRAGFILLGVALAKVLLHDLATSTAIARVASMLAIGVLFLVAAYAWERIRGGSLDVQTPR